MQFAEGLLLASSTEVQKRSAKATYMLLLAEIACTIPKSNIYVAIF
jgi:hypothetical protein